MQLAAASITVDPPAPPAPAIRNVFLTSSLATGDPSALNSSTLMVSFEQKQGHEYGGHRSVTKMVNGRATGISMHAFVAYAPERRAAQAVLDAVVASGLITAELPPLDWKHPAVGRTRLYLDRRSRFLEFDTANPPAVVRPVLDALKAYELVARRNRPVAA